MLEFVVLTDLTNCYGRAGDSDLTRDSSRLFLGGGSFPRNLFEASFLENLGNLL